VRSNSFETMQDWIQRFPELAGVYSAYDDMGAGVVDAIKAAQKTGRIMVSSSNLSHVGEEMLRAGDIVCQTTQQMVLQGQAAVEAAVAAANGETPEMDVVTTAIMVTRDNIDSVDFATIRAPADYRP
jgi:ABC-type sugar transport system substrate-binding protein